VNENGSESHLFGVLSHISSVRVRPWSDFNRHDWPPGYAMDWHAHEHVQCIHVLRGVLHVDWGRSWHEVSSGQVHVLPQGMRHRLKTVAGEVQFGLNFLPDPDERGLLGALTAACRVPTIVALPFRPTWEAYLRWSAPLGTLARLRQLHVLEEYTIALIEALSPAHEPEGIDRLIQAIEDRACESIAVQELASRLNLSRTALQRLCSTHFGCGVAHLHERLRLEHAATMLASQATPVKAIAERCGYPDIYRFSRAFKRVHGRSPRAFRCEAAAGRG
jgi:AraC-like DNA-binding protein